MIQRLVVLIVICLIQVPFGLTVAAATDAAWAHLATGGYSILMTHAQAPGVGDPPFFDIEDCTTQRNLSDRGRQQASRRGTRFAARAVSISRIYSSRWCRTIETAENAFRNTEIVPSEALDLVEDDPEALAAKTEGAIEIIEQFRGPGNQVLMTHPQNVEALTGTLPRPGEAIIMAPSGSKDPEGPRLREVGRILLD